MRIFSHMSAFEDNCTLLSGYRIKRLSHHQYLNCYTFEPVNMNAANETTFLSLIVAFLPDVFEQARGLRVVIHEAGTMPDLEKKWYSCEPDLDVKYNYTHTQCLLVHQQIEIMNNCHCIYVMHPRLVLPIVIGGLCSLTIGLTAAFFVELFEFGYLLYRNNVNLHLQTEKCIQLQEIHNKLKQKNSCLSSHHMNTSVER
ncbi:unnamed protein product [Schistosoma turkestanicum]|nr:unnamed protein product [Schistosoma turkestanicum]